MYLVYIDESGSHDDGSYKKGVKWSPQNQRESKYFILTCLVVNKKHWRTLFKKLKSIRENIKCIYKIPLSEYLHANEIVSGTKAWRHEKRKEFTRIKRVKFLKNLLHEYAQLNKFCYYGTVYADKCTALANPSKCRDLAYENLLNRLEKDLDDDYVVIHDGQEDGSIIRLLRKKRVFNFVQGKKFALNKLIEDPLFKMANNSYFLQLVDHICYTILHYYDDSLPNRDVGALYTESRLSMLGNAKMCYKTRGTHPGHIPVPSPKP